METYHEERYREMGIEVRFVQDNLSYSKRGVLRGLHYQWPNAQAKLVQVLDGEIFDVAVDIRKNSPTFGKWVGKTLSGANRKQLYIPAGFAHGYCVLSENAILNYKCNNFYSSVDEKGILWNDSTLQIDWPIVKPIISNKDSNLPSF